MLSSILLAASLATPSASFLEDPEPCATCSGGVTSGAITDNGTTIVVGGSLIKDGTCQLNENFNCVADTRCNFTRVKTVVFGPGCVEVTVYGYAIHPSVGPFDFQRVTYPSGAQGATYSEGGNLNVPCTFSFIESVEVKRTGGLGDIEASGLFACGGCSSE